MCLSAGSCAGNDAFKKDLAKHAKDVDRKTIKNDSFFDRLLEVVRGIFSRRT